MLRRSGCSPQTITTWLIYHIWSSKWVPSGSLVVEHQNPISKHTQETFDLHLNQAKMLPTIFWNAEYCSPVASKNQWMNNHMWLIIRILFAVLTPMIQMGQLCGNQLLPFKPLRMALSVVNWMMMLLSEPFRHAILNEVTMLFMLIWKITMCC